MPARRTPARAATPRSGARRNPRGGPPASNDPDPGAPREAVLAEARDHAVLAAALDPIITIDAFGVIQSASDSVERVFGWTPAELTGRNIAVLMPEPHHSSHDRYLADYRRTGRTGILGRTREFEGVRRNGEKFPIELSVSRVTRQHAAEALFVGIIRDITERKRMERELRLVQELALSISPASNLTDALVETIRRIALATQWDYGEAWIRSKNGADLVPAASWADPDGGLASFADSTRGLSFPRGRGLPGRAWAAGQPIWVGDLRALSKADFCRPAEARAAGLRAAAAVPVLSETDPIAVLVFFVRKTRNEDRHLLQLVRAGVAPLGPLILRKRAEEELDEYRRRLEERVEERTRLLQESQDKLRFADRLASIGTLAAGLGHDMNNVLLPVRAHLNALRAEADGLSPAARGHLESIRRSTAYLQQLAEGLHFLSMDPAKGAHEGESTPLQTWWAQAGVLIAKAVPRHVRVRSSFPRHLPDVAVAAAGLTQAVLNLVVNAGEAIPAGRKRVQGTVRVAAEADPARRSVRLSVSDNGDGMTADVRRRAFEVFFTTKPRGLGTGLGLALVRKVAEDAGGSVEIESEPGKGTTVTMLLPAAQITPPPRGAPARALRPIAMVSIDDGRHAAVVRQLLESAGARAAMGERAADEDIWVVEPATDLLDPAERWRARRPDGRLVLFGSPVPRSARAWAALQPVVIDRPDDFELVRAALVRALSP